MRVIDTTVTGEDDSTTALAPLARNEVMIDGLGVIVTIDAEVLALRDTLAKELASFGEPTEATLEDADKLLGRLALHNRGVESDRKRFTAPFLAAQRATNAAAEAAKLGDEEETFRKKVTAILDAIEARRKAQEEERARVAREAAEAAARAEREAAEQRAAIAALEAKATTPEDKAVVAELRAESEAAVADVKREAMLAGGRAWAAAATLGSTPAPRVKASSRNAMRLEIYDLDEIPRVVNGKVCMEPKTGMITTLLKGGTPVPGCRLVEVKESTSGRR
jgi:hypothetical protein